VFKNTSTNEGIIYQLWGNCPLDDMFVPTPNGLIENVAIHTSNLWVEGEFTLMSQVEGAQISPPLANNT
jgi:hypothetical protein